jgi:hypothetical protein
MLIALCGPRGCALKADPLLSGMIMELKVDCLRICHTLVSKEVNQSFHTCA